MKSTSKTDEHGTVFWYKEGTNILHRENGPAIEWYDGTKEYLINGQHHRLNGPAVEYPNGMKEYWINDKLHKEDGPAIECSDGSKEYWINGKQLTEEEFNNRN